jgi:hypothetical protein
VARQWFGNRFGKFHFNENVALPEELGAPIHHCGAHVGKLNPTKVLEDSIEDMMLLGRFDGLICDTWSSFSRHGKAIGGYKERQALYEVSPPREGRNIREKRMTQ